MEMNFINISMQSYLIVLVRLVVSVILGALIGIERANSKHDAGLRTHIIVCLGAASVMITSQLISVRYGNITDITRLGAQVISGIGFLGAGSIIVSKSKVRGLTTAAGLWTTACLGLVIGSGFIEVAVTIVALMMFTIYVLKPLSTKINAGEISFEIGASLENHNVTDYVEAFVRFGYEIVSVKSNSEKAVIIIKTDVKMDRNEMVRTLLSVDGVKSVSEA